MADRYVSTFDAISSLVERFGSQRAAARFLGIAPGVISDIINGRGEHLGRERENEIRAALALPALPKRVTIDACEDCGSVHHGRCHNREVTIKPVRARCEPTRWADYRPPDLAAAIRNRIEYPPTP